MTTNQITYGPQNITPRDAIKILHPRMRRTQAVGITHNGSRRREYSCVCGASITCCNQYAPTKRVLAFIEDHNERCGHNLVGTALHRLIAQSEIPTKVASW